MLPNNVPGDISGYLPDQSIPDLPSGRGFREGEVGAQSRLLVKLATREAGEERAGGSEGQGRSDMLGCAWSEGGGPALVPGNFQTI